MGKTRRGEGRDGEEGKEAPGKGQGQAQGKGEGEGEEEEEGAEESQVENLDMLMSKMLAIRGTSTITPLFLPSIPHFPFFSVFFKKKTNNERQINPPNIPSHPINRSQRRDARSGAPTVRSASCEGAYEGSLSCVYGANTSAHETQIRGIGNREQGGER